MWLMVAEQQIKPPSSEALLRGNHFHEYTPLPPIPIKLDLALKFADCASDVPIYVSGTPRLRDLDCLFRALIRWYTVLLLSHHLVSLALLVNPFSYYSP